MGLEWPLTAEENVRFFAALCGMPAALVPARTEAALRDVGLWDDRHKYPSQLSNGMRQRVILARALLLRTPLVLLDEPTVGLDPLNTRAMLDLIRGPLRERGQTILLTDHQSAEMEGVADRVAVLRAGRLAMLGTPAEIRGQLAHLRSSRSPPRRWTCRSCPPRHSSSSRSMSSDRALWGCAPGVSTRGASQGALEAVLDWITQPRGRVVFLAQSAPTFADALALPCRGDAAQAPLEDTASRAMSSYRPTGGEVEADERIGESTFWRFQLSLRGAHLSQTRGGSS